MNIDIKRELSLVTIGTAVAYLSAYFYQLGFFAYFSVPSGFVSVDINTLLFSAVLVVFILYAIFGPSLIYCDVFDEKEITKKQRVCNVIVFYLMFTVIYSVAFYGLQKLNSNAKELGGAMEIIKSATASLIWNAFVLVCTYYFSKIISLVLMHPWKKTQYFFAMNISPIFLFVAYFAGVNYAKIDVAKYSFGNDGYFVVTENSKGILVAKCDANNGVSFKRLESSFSDIKTNTNSNEKDEVVNCLKIWRDK
ncbi:hypothetical protein [Serratia marcescens]|uniref:hypothetical protein n=1 Tax=Serratia marcescens TaxID=615 RepID=UPI000EFD3B8F|nr:hypothetical protein [Serratia marcescens]